MKLKEIKNVISNKIFKKYLMFTNIVLNGVMMGAADVCEQGIEIYFGEHDKFNFIRTRNMGTVGFAFGAPQHFAYTFLDKYLPGTSKRVVFSKILFDELFIAPSSIFVLIVGMNLLEKRGFEKGLREFKKKFIPIYLVDIRFWPPAQAINFFFVSARFRVLYVTVATYFYNIFLSYAKHHSMKKKKKPPPTNE